MSLWKNPQLLPLLCSQWSCLLHDLLLALPQSISLTNTNAPCSNSARTTFIQLYLLPLCLSQKCSQISPPSGKQALLQNWRCLNHSIRHHTPENDSQKIILLMILPECRLWKPFWANYVHLLYSFGQEGWEKEEFCRKQGWGSHHWFWILLFFFSIYSCYQPGPGSVCSW